MITALMFKTRSLFTFLDVIFDFRQGCFVYFSYSHDIYESAVHHKEFHGLVISAIVL
jgi:hypothetical protein